VYTLPISNGMRAFIVAMLLLVLGGIGALFMLGSHITYTFIGDNLAQVFAPSKVGDLTAEAYLIQNLQTDEVIIEKNKDTAYPIASLAKLFTAAIANSPDNLEKETLIVWQDYVTEGSGGSLWLGQTYSVRELLFPLLLSSSNDAAAAVARVIGHEAFASARTKLLSDAGLTHTTLVDSSGLSDSNISTASELAAFLKHVKNQHPYVLDITTLKSYMGPYHGWINNNPGAVHENYKGGKHGYTYVAGRTFAGIFEKDGKEYAVVLLKSSDLPQDIEIMASLLP
jgi:D-alanyl-D-alanine carboxypeptidase